MSRGENVAPADRTLVVLPDVQDRAMAALAHELKSPVKAVQLLAQAVRASAHTLPPEQVQRSMESILRSAHFMADLIERLNTDPWTMDQSRLHLRPTDLGVLVRETVQDMARLLEGRPIRMSIAPDQIVQVDPVRIRQIIVNLLTNAARFGQAYSPVTIELRRSIAGVALTISDRCGGIAPEARSWIFEPHATSRGRPEGHGLGLFLSRAIARAHGGDLTADSGDPGSCRLTLRIPRNP